MCNTWPLDPADMTELVLLDTDIGSDIDDAVGAGWYLQVDFDLNERRAQRRP